jgi:tetratricopeptide (TPR) repeat protein
MSPFMSDPIEPPAGSDCREGHSAPEAAGDRLDGWKSIASHLRRDIRTVQRWEQREGLPVHRHEHQRQATAYAYGSELDQWRRRRSADLPLDEPPLRPDSPNAERGRRWWLVSTGVLAAVAIVAVVVAMRVGRERTVGRDTRDAQAYAAFAQGQALYHARRYRDAIEALQQAVTRDQQFGAAWALLAKAYARLAPPAWAGGTDSAVHATQAALRAGQLAPREADTHVALALAARARGEVLQWRAEAQRALSLDPRAAEAYAVLGDSYSGIPYVCGREVDAERADEYYRQALQLKPDLNTAVSNRATNLRRLGRYGECIELVDRALRSLTDETPLRLVRGGCRLMAGDLEGAAADIVPLRDSPKLSPVGPLVLLGLLELKRGETGVGVRDLELAAQVHEGAEAELFVAEAYAAAQDSPHLVAHLKRAFALDASCRGFVASSPAFRAVRDTSEIRELLTLPSRR